MVDAVESGAYGVLALPAAQTPIVPDPPRQTSATVAAGQSQAAAVVPTPAAAQVGSEPVAPARSDQDSSATSGRDYADQDEALARQSAMAVSLGGDGRSRRLTATTGSASGTPSAARMGWALRAYSKAAAPVYATTIGAMLSLQA